MSVRLIDTDLLDGNVPWDKMCAWGNAHCLHQSAEKRQNNQQSAQDSARHDWWFRQR